MPPKSAAELALQHKYEALRRKKQEAARRKQEAPIATKPAEDPARAAAIKALKAQKAARDQPSSEDGPQLTSTRASTDSRSPQGIKLKFVIPKKDSESNQEDQGKSPEPALNKAVPAKQGSQHSERGTPRNARRSSLPPKSTSPPSSSLVQKPAPAQAPTDAGAGHAAAATPGAPPHSLPHLPKQPSTTPANPDTQPGAAATAGTAGPKRPSAAATRRLPSRRPALPSSSQPLQQQDVQGAPQEGGDPAEGYPGGSSDSPYPMADAAAVYGGYPPVDAKPGCQGDGYEEGYGEEYERSYGGGDYGADGGGYGGGGYAGDAGYYDEGHYEEGGYGEEERYAKRRRGEVGRHETSGREGDCCTLFVGDLPAFWASRDLEEFFSQFGAVRSARVMGSQCYGFVTLTSRQEAEALLESALQQPLVVEGHGPLRVNWSQGSMPEWKKGPAIVRPRQAGEGPHGLESYEHPRVREARLAAQAVISRQDLAEVNMAGPPPSREVVAYDDL